MPTTLYQVRALRKVSHDNVDRIPGDVATQDFWVDATTRDLLVSMNIVQVLSGGAAQPQIHKPMAGMSVVTQGGMSVSVVDPAGADMGFLLMNPEDKKLSSGSAAAVVDLAGYKQPSDSPSLAFPFISRMTRKALSNDLAAAPLAPIATSELYIDFNRGNDANPGTRVSPKKNVSVLHGANFGAGSVIALASDSSWQLTSYVNMDNIKGVDGNPVTITAYDPAGHTGMRPRLTNLKASVAGDWTWVAAKNAWKMSTGNAWIGPGTVLFFGAGKEHGLRIWQDQSQPAMLGDRQWGARTDYATYSEIYVYAPANTNPVNYYGGVFYAVANVGVFHSAWQGMRHTVFDGLEFFDSGSGVLATPNAGAGAHQGLVVKNCHAARSQLLDFYSAENAAHQFTAFGNTAADLPHTMIKLAGSGTFTADIYRNKCSGAGIQYGAMGAIYTQAKAASMGDIVVRQNYLTDCVNGAGSELGAGYGCAFDGAAIYADLGADKTLFFGNLMERCGKPIQTNSAKSVQVISNIVVDCESFSSHTDAGLAGSNNVTIAHNTYVSTKPVGTYKTGRSVPLDGGCLNAWFESGAGATQRVFNNAFVTQFERGGSTIRMSAEATTQFCGGNAVAGWNNAQGLVVQKSVNSGAVQNLTATGAPITTGDIDAWFVKGSVAPRTDGPLSRAGVRHMADLFDATGTPFDVIPSIGAVEVDREI
jgi:hypothetical protein